MNLNKQIKKYREQANLSQEQLAEKIYVSRQTISNWETGRSYPDIENLLLISVYFDVSLDELVKGDVEEMKEKIETDKLRKLSRVMFIFILLMAISAGPAAKFFGWWGMLVPLFFIILALISTLKMEKIKKENNIKTYAEIVAYFDNGNLDAARKNRNKKKDIPVKFLIVLYFTLISTILAILSFAVIDFFL